MFLDRCRILSRFHLRKSFRTLMNAPGPPSSLISLTSTSVCWYSRSMAAAEDLPSETRGEI